MKKPIWFNVFILLGVIICIYLLYNILLDVPELLGYIYRESRITIGAENEYGGSDYVLLRHFFGAIDNLFNIFNVIAINILKFGHFVLFFMYSFMGINLFRKSKKIVFIAQTQGISKSFVKKKSINVSCALVLVGFGFLTGVLTKFLLIFFQSSPDSLFLIVLNKENFYKVDSINLLSRLELFDRFLYLLLCFGSFLGFVVLSYGCYILFFGKSVLKSKSRPSGYIVLGIILLIIFGIVPFLKILNSIF